eukprot:gene9905-2227_t
MNTTIVEEEEEFNQLLSIEDKLVVVYIGKEFLLNEFCLNLSELYVYCHFGFINENLNLNCVKKYVTETPCVILFYKQEKIMLIHNPSKNEIKNEISKFYNRKYKLENKKRFWIYNPPSLKSPPRIRRHTAVSKGDSIFIFGGISGTENTMSSKFHNNIHQYNCVTEEWSIVEEENKKIHGRCGHTAVVYEHFMYVYGGSFGIGNSKGYLRDFNRFNFVSKNWENLNDLTLDNNNPPHLSYHQCCLYDHKLIIYGGALNGSQGLSPNIIYIYDLKKLNWKKLKTTGFPDSILEVVSHSCVVFENHLYLLELSKHFFKLNLITFEWKIIGELPEEIVGYHSRGCVVFKNKLYVYGGMNPHLRLTSDKFYEFDFNSESWAKVVTYGDGPKCRSKHSMVINFRNELVFFGGCDANISNISYFNDLYFLKFGIDDCLDLMLSKLKNSTFADVEFVFLEKKIG